MKKVRATAAEFYARSKVLVTAVETRKPETKLGSGEGSELGQSGALERATAALELQRAGGDCRGGATGVSIS